MGRAEPSAENNEKGAPEKENFLLLVIATVVKLLNNESFFTLRRQ